MDLTQRLIDHYAGLAKLSGVSMHPSDFVSRQVPLIKSELIPSKSKYVKIGNINAVIYYPDNWGRNSRSHCILYHNPHLVLVENYLVGDQLHWTPRNIELLRQCPMIFFDYSLTTSNEKVYAQSVTAQSQQLIHDSCQMIEYALINFERVDIWGSSLGGTIAAIALDKYLSRQQPTIDKQVASNYCTLTLHDAITDTAMIALPRTPSIARWMAYLPGNTSKHLDLRSHLQSLIRRGIMVTLIAHEKDPIVPLYAQPYTDLGDLLQETNVHLILSPLEGHANITPDIFRRLQLSHKKLC